MKKFILILTLFPVALMAQGNNPAQNQNQMNAARAYFNDKSTGYIPIYKVSDEDIKGSKYFNEEYAEGELWATDGKHFTNQYLYKFNELENTVQVKGRNGQELTLSRNDILACRIDIGTRSALFFKSELPNSPDKVRLLQLIYDSDSYQLLKLPAKRLKSRPQGVLNASDFKDEYVAEPRFFLKEGNRPFVEIKLKKNDILKALPKKSSELNALFEKEEYKGRLNEEDMSNILKALEDKK